jgi:hypothetical protein
MRIKIIDSVARESVDWVIENKLSITLQSLSIAMLYLSNQNTEVVERINLTKIINTDLTDSFMEELYEKFIITEFVKKTTEFKTIEASYSEIDNILLKKDMIDSDIVENELSSKEKLRVIASQSPELSMAISEVCAITKSEQKERTKERHSINIFYTNIEKIRKKLYDSILSTNTDYLTELGNENIQRLLSKSSIDEVKVKNSRKFVSVIKIDNLQDYANNFSEGLSVAVTRLVTRVIKDLTNCEVTRIDNRFFLNFDASIDQFSQLKILQNIVVAVTSKDFTYKKTGEKVDKIKIKGFIYEYATSDKPEEITGEIDGYMDSDYALARKLKTDNKVVIMLK